MDDKIIDTHIHIWNMEKLTYGWLEGNETILNQSYHCQQIDQERKEVGIVGGVLVQADNHFEDTDWMLQNAEQTSWIKGVVGWVPLTNPETTSRALEKYTANPYFKGVRHLIHDEKDPKWLLQPSVIESLQILADYALTYDLVGILPGHIETALNVADQVPKLQMVFDHLNQPPISKKERFGSWGTLMREAASHSGFHQKISGLGTATGNLKGWQADDLKPYLEFVLEHFGAERCFCGGDWPVSLLAGTYTKTWAIYKQVLGALLDEKQLEAVFYQNAKNFYQLDL